MTDAPKDNTPPADGKTPPADNTKKPDTKPEGSKPDGAAPDGKQPDAAAAGSPYKPDGLAEHFLGKDDKETIDKLNTAVTNFRKELSKKGVPESADGYTLELPDEIKTKVLKPGEDGKDPVLEKMKPILHKHHIPAQAFQELATEFYGVVAELKGAADKNPDGSPVADFEFKELGGADKAKPQIDAAETWIRGLEQTKKISAKLASELKLMTGYGEGLTALNELRNLMGGTQTIPRKLDGDGSQPKVTKEALDARVQDERYWLKKDPQFIAETTQMFQEFYAA